MSDQSSSPVEKSEVRKLLDMFIMNMEAEVKAARYKMYSGSLMDMVNFCKDMIVRIENAIDDNNLRLSGEVTVRTVGEVEVRRVWVEKKGKVVPREYYVEIGNEKDTGHGVMADRMPKIRAVPLSGERVMESVCGRIIMIDDPRA